MIAPIFLIGGVAAALFLSSRRKTVGADSFAGYAIGEGPFESFPSGTDDVVTSINAVKSSAGNPYTVHEFKRGEQRYYVAVRSDASKDWVGYLFDPVSKTRVLYRANADGTSGVDALRKDFAL
jgi:hypothetical protein